MAMMINLVFIAISFVLGFFVTAYIRSFDIYEKEPLSKMILVVIWGGIWSIVICSLLYGIFENFGVSKLSNFWGAIFVIGPVEEAAKFLALLSVYYFIKDEINEPTDGLIYMTCVALGFSLIENYFYAIKTPDSGYLLFARLLISTPAHIFFSIFMGISFYVIIKYRTGMVLLLVSYLYASIIHGLFNTIIFHGWLFVLLLFLMTLSKDWAFSLLSYTAAKSPFKKSLKEFIESYGETRQEKGLECLHCGSKNNKETFRSGKIYFQKCDQCQSYVCNKGHIFHIFRHFSSSFGRVTDRYWDAKLHNRQYSTLHKGNCISDEKGLASFSLDEFDMALNEVQESYIHNFENKWWFPDKLKLNGATTQDKKTKAIIIPILIFVFILGVGLSGVESMEKRIGIIMILVPLVFICYGFIYSIVSNAKELINTDKCTNKTTIVSKQNNVSDSNKH